MDGRGRRTVSTHAKRKVRWAPVSQAVLIQPIRSKCAMRWCGDEQFYERALREQWAGDTMKVRFIVSTLRPSGRGSNFSGETEPKNRKLSQWRETRLCSRSSSTCRFMQRPAAVKSFRGSEHVLPRPPPPLTRHMHRARLPTWPAANQMNKVAMA